MFRVLRCQADLTEVSMKRYACHVLVERIRRMQERVVAVILVPEDHTILLALKNLFEECVVGNFGRVVCVGTQENDSSLLWRLTLEGFVVE